MLLRIYPAHSQYHRFCPTDNVALFRGASPSISAGILREIPIHLALYGSMWLGYLLLMRSLVTITSRYLYHRCLTIAVGLDRDAPNLSNGEDPVTKLSE